MAPSAKWLALWKLADDQAGARRYCDILLAACAESVAAVKIQVPFFMRFGEPGVRLLRWFTDRAHDNGTLVLLDAKLCDAADTMDAWAQFALGPASVLGGDAVTAHCYMGFESLDPLLLGAAATGTAVFVIVRTSNHAAEEVQRASAGGLTMAEFAAGKITDWNSRHAAGQPAGPAGAVVGARDPESSALYRRLPRSLVEVPGLGRSDRSAVELLGAAAQLGWRALYTVTTGVLASGPDAGSLRSALSSWSLTIGQVPGDR